MITDHFLAALSTTPTKQSNTHNLCKTEFTFFKGQFIPVQDTVIAKYKWSLLVHTRTHSESDATGYLHKCMWDTHTHTHTPQSLPISIFIIHSCIITSIKLNTTNHLRGKFIKMHFYLKGPAILKWLTADQGSMHHIYFRPTVPNSLQFLSDWPTNQDNKMFTVNCFITVSCDSQQMVPIYNVHCQLASL